MALVLHYHPLSSYCWKVLIALYEKGLPFGLATVDLGNPDERSAYAGLWPTAKIPLLQDGNRYIPETSIQIEHLDLHYPGKLRLLPGDPTEQLDVRLWDRVFDNYVMSPLQQAVGYYLRPEAQRDPLALDTAREQLTTAYGMIETRMPGGTWAVGDAFTLADCAAAPSLFYAAIFHPIPAGHPRLSAYFERLIARPSVARVIADARPWLHHFPLADRVPARFLQEPAVAG